MSCDTYRTPLAHRNPRCPRWAPDDVCPSDFESTLDAAANGHEWCPLCVLDVAS